MDKINQLCRIIAASPSKINLLNEAVTIAMGSELAECFRPILKLAKSIGNDGIVGKFKEGKMKVVFAVLLQQYLQEPVVQTCEMLGEAFSLVSDKETVMEGLVNQVLNGEMQWDMQLPSVVLVFLMEKLLQKVQLNMVGVLKEAVKMIIELPKFEQLQVSSQGQVDFKRAFQKLLLGVIGHPNIDKPLLLEIFHNLGEKVLSKLQNPLVLSNICIQSFATDPELQIEVLSCLFILVGKYGLELEEFYPKLQQLIKKREKGKSVYELPNSRRFFRLLEASLRSSRVPFKTVSAFAHLIIQQTAGEQSQFAFWALSFVVNLVKKHRKLLDQLPSLPELKTLKHHYNSKVRGLVQELSKNLNKVDYLEIDEFSGLDCKQIAEAKMRSLVESLSNEELEFKIPVFDDSL